MVKRAALEASSNADIKLPKIPNKVFTVIPLGLVCTGRKIVSERAYFNL